MKKLLRGALAIVLVVGACSDDDDSSADADAVVAAMVDEGSSEEQARCLVDELGAADAERMLSADESELSEREVARFTEAAIECMPEPGEEGSPADALDEMTSASVDPDEVEACLLDAGLDVNRDGGASPELTESIGILATFSVVSTDGMAGSVTVYETLSVADDARAVEEDMLTDDAFVGQRGTVVYSIYGAEADVQVIEDCL